MIFTRKKTPNETELLINAAIAVSALLLASAAHAQTTTVTEQPGVSYTATTSNPDGSYTYGRVTKEPGGYYSTTTSKPDGRYTYGTIYVQPKLRNAEPPVMKVAPKAQPSKPRPLGH